MESWTVPKEESKEETNPLSSLSPNCNSTNLQALVTKNNFLELQKTGSKRDELVSPDDVENSYPEGQEDPEDEIENLYDKISQLEKMKNSLASLDFVVTKNQQWGSVLPSTRDFHERIDSLSFFYKFLLNSKIPYHLDLGYFGLLPVEILLHLFSYFNVVSLARMSQVHSTFDQLAKEPELWMGLCKRDYHQLSTPPQGKSWKWLYRAQYVLFQAPPSHDGPGTYIHTDSGGKFIGDWKNGKKHGFGWFFWADDGRKYCGNWADDKRDGYGRYSYPDGTAYEGQWLKDKRNGFGTYSWADGRQYCGEWNAHRKNGYGIHIWPDGSTYRGNWKNGSRNGYGVFSWIDGRIYKGMWKTGKINGTGTFTWPDNDRYYGAWVQGRRVGNGVFRTASGKSYNQSWNELKFERTCKGSLDNPIQPNQNELVTGKPDQNNSLDSICFTKKAKTEME